MSEKPSLRPSRERLWAHLPGIYRSRDRETGGVLERLLNVIGVGLDAARDDVLRLLDDCFVETCDARLVPLIGDLVGISVDPLLPVTRQRHQVKYALHWRRRQGTSAQLEALGWQQTGFPTEVREAPGISLEARERRGTRISGGAAPVVGARTRPVLGEVPARHLLVTLRVAWPVSRTQRHLVPIGDGVIHALDPDVDVGLRRSDGSPIFYGDDPTALVGPGLAIEVDGVDADFPAQGPLVPRFMPLPGDRAPYIPGRTLAIDPERGRVAGPTPPLPGVEGHRRYLLTYWRPTGAERHSGAPAALGPGLLAFSPDGRQRRLTDEEGVALVVHPFGECHPPQPGPDERLIVRFGEGELGTATYVVGPPGEAIPASVVGAARRSMPSRPLGHLSRRADRLPGGAEATQATELAAQEGWLALDTAGLSRFFAIRDDTGWDRFSEVHLVPSLTQRFLHDDAVEVDLRTGRFRMGAALSSDALTVTFYRPFDLDGLKRRGLQALRAAVPLGRRASFAFRDTAPGRSTQGIS